MAQGLGLRNYFVNNEPRLRSRLQNTGQKLSVTASAAGLTSRDCTTKKVVVGMGRGGFCLQAARQPAATSRSFIPLYVSTESKLVRVAGELRDSSQCSG